MLKSMTGFGNAQAENSNFLVSIEIRCVNSKFLDINFRLPKNLSDKELEFRNLLNPLERGKVNLQVDIQSKGEVKPSASINSGLLKIYYDQLKNAVSELHADGQDIFRIAMQMPEVIQYKEDDEQIEILYSLLQKSVAQAIKNCDDFRKAEGNVLEEKFIGYINNIKNLLKSVEEQDPKRIETIKNKIQNRMIEISKDEKFDKNRFEQELIYYIEKLDISEEKVRLATHLNYFLEVIKEENQGRKLNFISQEIGREINTIGSKANDAMIQRYVVEMKEELEKIKEQGMNVL